MELTWIDDFLALEQTRNFTRAATLRHTTQSAYSRRVARLEDWLGCKLFKRDTRPVELTPEGSAFLARAQNLRTDILDTRRAMQAMASHYSSALRIYTTNTIAIGFFSDWARTEKLQHYSLSIASVTGCLEALAAGRCDRIIVPVLAGDHIPEQFHARVIGTDQLRLMARRDVAAVIKLERRLIHGPIMMYGPGTRYGTAIIDAMAGQHIALATPPICESASAEALAAQARAGLGAAWIPRSVSTPDLQSCKAGAKLDIPYDIVLLSAQH